MNVVDVLTRCKWPDSSIPVVVVVGTAHTRGPNASQQYKFTFDQEKK